MGTGGQGDRGRLPRLRLTSQKGEQHVDELAPDAVPREAKARVLGAGCGDALSKLVIADQVHDAFCKRRRVVGDKGVDPVVDGQPVESDRRADHGTSGRHRFQGLCGAFPKGP